MRHLNACASAFPHFNTLCVVLRRKNLSKWNNTEGWRLFFQACIFLKQDFKAKGLFSYSRLETTLFHYDFNFSYMCVLGSSHLINFGTAPTGFSVLRARIRLIFMRIERSFWDHTGIC